MPATLVIAYGNPLRGDDAAGLAVARLLRDQQPAGVRVIEHTGEAIDLLDLWADATLVILVDAASTGAPPGTIHHLDATVDPLPAGFRATSSHALGPAEAIELARALGRLPARLIVYAIEGERFELGTALSPAVAPAVAATVARVLEEA